MKHEPLIQGPLFPDPHKGGENQNGALRPKLERDSEPGALGAAKEKAGDSGRILVRVVSVRKRLIDEDNLCEKYVIDCCRYAGLIPGDDPAGTKIETTQRKALKGEEEHTLIEIIKPE